jgi:hypothetical protein
MTTLADLGPQDPLAMHGPAMLVTFVVMLVASVYDPAFDDRFFAAFALYVGMFLETQYLPQMPAFANGLWFDWLDSIWEIHKWSSFLNVIPVALALTGMHAAWTYLEPHVIDWTFPAHDLSLGQKLRSYAGFFILGALFPIVLAVGPLLSSVAFLCFVFWYLLGLFVVINWMVEEENKKKAAVTSTKGGISISPSTHLRVNDFWRIHMFPRPDLTKNMDFKTFTKDVQGHPAKVRNNKILDLFKETLTKAGHVVSDNR